MKRLDEVKVDIMRQPKQVGTGIYPCGCQIYRCIRKLCDRHFVMLNTETN